MKKKYGYTIISLFLFFVLGGRVRLRPTQSPTVTQTPAGCHRGLPRPTPQPAP